MLGFQPSPGVGSDRAASLDFGIHSSDVVLTEPPEQLAEELVAHAPLGLTRAFFTSGGSEAIEAAIMIAKQCASERGSPGRHKIVSRRKSFHGGTTTTLGIADHEPRKKRLEGILGDAIRIAPTYAYRDMHSDEEPEQYGLRIANELEAAIQSVAPGSVLAFIAETVCGGGYGALSPPPGYFKRIREICDQYENEHR